MSSKRTVKLFKNGRDQAVRIPREFEFSGDEAVMRKEGERLIIEPAPTKVPAGRIVDAKTAERGLSSRPRLATRSG